MEFFFSFFCWKFAAIAVISPLYIEEGGIFDGDKRRVGSILGISNPQELELLQPEKGLGENVVVDLLDWQVHYLFNRQLILFVLGFHRVLCI